MCQAEGGRGAMQSGIRPREARCRGRGWLTGHGKDFGFYSE